MKKNEIKSTGAASSAASAPGSVEIAGSTSRDSRKRVPERPRPPAGTAAGTAQILDPPKSLTGRRRRPARARCAFQKRFRPSLPAGPKKAWAPDPAAGHGAARGGKSAGTERQARAAAQRPSASAGALPHSAAVERQRNRAATQRRRFVSASVTKSPTGRRRWRCCPGTASAPGAVRCGAGRGRTSPRRAPALWRPRSRRGPAAAHASSRYSTSEFDFDRCNVFR